ncbi:MAG: hypothetical protein WCG75_08920, partial [Armatimonadota bacterium]
GMELTTSITVPANTSATVYIPTGGTRKVREGLTEASTAKGVKFLRSEPGYDVFQVGSGSYSFMSNIQAAGN